MNTDASLNSDFSLERDAWGILVMILADGRRIAGVEPARAFPISGPEGFFSICDAEGHEVVYVENASSLSPEVRRIIEEELSRSEFVPVVIRIEQVISDSDPSEWRIITDRGPTTFLMEDTDNDVRRLGSGRILLVDTHGIRYLIPNQQRLDAASRRILDRFA
jgi:hypothetical protein